MYYVFVRVSKILDSRFECVCSKLSTIVRVSVCSNFGTLWLHIRKFLFKQESTLISSKTLTWKYLKKKCLANIGLTIVQISACNYTVLNTYCSAYYCFR